MLYTGGLNMEYVTAYMNGITELEEFNGITGHGKAYYDVEEIISYAVEVINKTGYFNAQSSLPTKYLVADLMYNNLNKAVEVINEELMSAKLDVRVCKNDFHKDNTESIVKEIIEYYTNLEDDSEFIHNIKVMLDEKYILARNFGFLCYLPCGYAKHIQKEIERAKRIESNYFGEIGNRYKDKVIQDLTIITSWESQFGTTYVYKITLEDNSVLVWKTTNCLYLEDDQRFDKITFTVKEHKEYKNEKQTEITRCKVSIRKA